MLAFILVGVAVLLGAALVRLHLRPDPAPRWPMGGLHGLLGIGGFLALLRALQGPARGVAFGVGGFGRIAAVLLALALLAAIPIIALRLRHKRLPSWLIGSHATLAVSGVVILAAYTLVG